MVNLHDSLSHRTCTGRKENKMETIRKQLNYTQCTATGRDQSEATTVYAYRLSDDTLWVTTDRQDFPWWKIQAEYTIFHPWIMAGRWEEIRATFCRMVERDLWKNGYLVENDCGTRFWK